ncbi:unnamed protein product, partial [Rotaria sp. Silwood2]
SDTKYQVPVTAALPPAQQQQSRITIPMTMPVIAPADKP